MFTALYIFTVLLNSALYSSTNFCLRFNSHREHGDGIWEFWDTVAFKPPHKIEYIGLSERTQNILFELSIVNPIYLESHISRNPGVWFYHPSSIKILALIELWGCVSAHLIRVPSWLRVLLFSNDTLMLLQLLLLLRRRRCNHWFPIGWIHNCRIGRLVWRPGCAVMCNFIKTIIPRHW